MSHYLYIATKCDDPGSVRLRRLGVLSSDRLLAGQVDCEVVCYAPEYELTYFALADLLNGFLDAILFEASDRAIFKNEPNIVVKNFNPIELPR